MINCKNIGEMRGHGGGHQPHVFYCTSGKPGYDLCVLDNPTNHVFDGRTLPVCSQACEFFVEKDGIKVDCSQSSLPPYYIRGINFAAAMAEHAADGFRRCDQSEIEARLDVCSSCDKLVNDHCSLCGCACIAANRLTNKLALKSSSCPIEKWGKL